MKTTSIRVGALLVLLAVGAIGCNKTTSQVVRTNATDEATDSKITDVDASVPKGGRAGLMKGGWSDQSREIESHFAR
jgi:hypothetical protein